MKRNWGWQGKLIVLLTVAIVSLVGVPFVADLGATQGPLTEAEMARVYGLSMPGGCESYADKHTCHGLPECNQAGQKEGEDPATCRTEGKQFTNFDVIKIRPDASNNDTFDLRAFVHCWNVFKCKATGTVPNAKRDPDDYTKCKAAPGWNCVTCANDALKGVKFEPELKCVDP